MKRMLCLVALVMLSAVVQAQSVDPQILELKAQAAEAKGKATQRLLQNTYARERMCTLGEMLAYNQNLQVLNAQGLLNNLLDYAPGSFPGINDQMVGWMTDTLGYTDNPLFMCDEWGMDPNDPMTQMMLQYMIGPWKREHMFARHERLHLKASAIGGQALLLDESLVQFFDSYVTCVGVLATIDQEDPNNAAACMMYYWMIEWYEAQLTQGYTASYQAWTKSWQTYDQSRQDLESIDKWANEMFRVLSFFSFN